MLNVFIARLFILSCCVLAASPHLFAAEPAPQTQNEKESYSIGYQVGLSMKTDGVEVDFERLVQGLDDAINAKEPRLSTEEMRKLIVGLKKRARDGRMRKIQEQRVANAAESEKFLKENGKKKASRPPRAASSTRCSRRVTALPPGRRTSSRSTTAARL